MNKLSYSHFSLILNKELPLKDGSKAYDRWKNLDVPMDINFWIFSVKNPDEVAHNDVKPIIEEKGPYIFKEKREKFDIVNGYGGNEKHIHFREKKTYFYKEKETTNSGTKDISLEDEVTILNVPLMVSIITFLRYSSIFIHLFRRY
jgi:hypothetical protein